MQHMNILKYEKDKKDTYNVFLSNGEVLTLPEKVITENELLLKKEIDSTLYNKLQKDSYIYDIIMQCIKYIDFRLRSIKEIENYLLKKKISKEDILLVISKLEVMGYLDDNRFTKAFIKDKLNFTMMGDYKIRGELQKLGIESNIIEENMPLVDDDIIKDRIIKIIEKDLRTNKKYSGLKLKNKIYNHLLTQGYSKEKVISVINNYTF